MNDNLHHRIRTLEHALERRRHASRARHVLARRIAAVLGLLVIALPPSAAHSYPDAPHQFAPGDPVAAADFNENFQHVLDGVSALEVAAVPIGSVVAWAGTSAPPQGWLLCDGTEYASATYPDLAAVVGAAHGGDGATAFFTPDLRGRFLRGVDGGAGNDPDALDRVQPQMGSGSAGDLVGSVQSDAFEGHFHGTSINFPQNMEGPGAFGNGSAGVQGDVMFGAGAGTVHAQRTSTNGGSETRPTNVYVHFIIRAQ